VCARGGNTPTTTWSSTLANHYPDLPELYHNNNDYCYYYYCCYYYGCSRRQRSACVQRFIARGRRRIKSQYIGPGTRRKYAFTLSFAKCAVIWANTIDDKNTVDPVAFKFLQDMLSYYIIGG